MSTTKIGTEATNRVGILADMSKRNKTIKNVKVTFNTPVSVMFKRDGSIKEENRQDVEYFNDEITFREIEERLDIRHKVANPELATIQFFQEDTKLKAGRNKQVATIGYNQNSDGIISTGIYQPLTSKGALRCINKGRYEGEYRDYSSRCIMIASGLNVEGRQGTESEYDILFDKFKPRKTSFTGDIVTVPQIEDVAFDKDMYSAPFRGKTTKVNYVPRRI